MLDLFEVKRVYHSEVALDDLLASVPYGAPCAVKPDGFTLKEVDISDRAQVNEVLESAVGKSQGFELKLQPLNVFMLTQSDKRVMQINIVDLFLGLLFLGNCLNSFGFFKKVMIKVALEHQIVGVKFLEFLHKVLLLHDILDHLPGDNLSNVFDHSLKSDLRVVFCQCFVDLV